MELNNNKYMSGVHNPMPKASHVFRTHGTNNMYDPVGVADIPPAIFFTNLLSLRDMKK